MACSEIRKRAKIIDDIKDTPEQTHTHKKKKKKKRKWGRTYKKGHRWTDHCTEWQPRRRKRSKGRPSRR